MPSLSHILCKQSCSPYTSADSAALRFQCCRAVGAVNSDYHRLVWCPYIPDNTESTGSGSQNDDGSVLVMVSHDNIVSRRLFA